MIAARRGSNSELEANSSAQLQLREIAGNLRAGPVLGIHKLSPQHTLSIDDVGLRNLLSAVKREDAPILIANGKHIDVMLDQKTVVNVRILVHANRHNREVRHLPLQSQQTRKLFDARSTKSCPQIQHHHASAQLT